LSAQRPILRVPHNGPDDLENLLCLCPNHHVLFDKGAIYIDSNRVVRQTADQAALGELRVRANHRIAEDYVAYHREHFARGA
jgi:putative restriction endonuclease